MSDSVPLRWLHLLNFNSFIVILAIIIIIIISILISIIIIAYNLIEDLDSLPMTEQQYWFWNSMHVVIRKLLHFALLHYALEKLLQFALKDYYILCWKFYYVLRQCYILRRNKRALQTELSTYISSLKDKNAKYDIKWRKIKQASSYSNVTKRCNLCLWEKYFIICKPEMASLNKRNELSSCCRHVRKFLLKNVTM